MFKLRAFWPFFNPSIFSLTMGLLLMCLATFSGLLLLGWASHQLLLMLIVGSSLVMVGGSLGGFTLLRAGLKWLERVVTHHATFDVLARLRSGFFYRLAQQPPRLWFNLRSAELLNRFIHDIDIINQSYLRLVAPFINAWLVSLLLAVAFSWISPMISAMFLLFMASITLVWPLLFYQLHLKDTLTLTKIQQRCRTAFSDFLTYQRELRLTGQDQHGLTQLSQQHDLLVRTQQQQSRLKYFAKCFFSLLYGALILWVLHFGMTHQIAAVSLIVVLVLLFACAEFITPLATWFTYLTQSHIASLRLNAVQAVPTADSLIRLNHVSRLSVQQLGFSHGSHAILQNVNFSLERQQSMLIEGESGAGKTSLFHMLSGFLSPTNGAIFLDDTDITMLDESNLYQHIGVMPQFIDVLNDTLLANLRLAQPQARESELIEILYAVQLSHLVPQGEADLKQWLGDGGRQLSGGERKRLGLARVLLKRPSFILLDEPTEGLDPHNSHLMEECIAKHCFDSGLLIISHKSLNLKFNQHLTLPVLSEN